MSDWFEAAVWGLIQGLTEFLPVSSSGHLVVVPGFLGIEAPDLGTSALLHLGTLMAVLVHYRGDLAWLLRSRTDPVARRVLGLLVVASLPSALALLVRDEVAALQASTTAVGVALLTTGAVLWVADWFVDRGGPLETMGRFRALGVGFAQLAAVVPGISRSGVTIAVGTASGLSRVQAARFSFLLGIPAIAAAGMFEGRALLGGAGIHSSAWLGVAAAGVSGYVAISLLLRVLERVGLRPFAPYCVLVGAATLVWL